MGVARFSKPGAHRLREWPLRLAYVLDPKRRSLWHALCKSTRAAFDPQSFERIVMKIVAALTLAGLMAVLTGCNTVEGAGKDVKATGAAVERAADKAKPN